MDPGDWERIKQIFSAALSVAADRREAYVLEVCADRADLRRAVTDLLSAHYDASNTFLESGGLLFDAPWLFRPLDQIGGRFRIVRAIARGAMGEVYEADDDRLRLRVALKALRPRSVGDVETSERFRREVLVTRDILHEGLCRVFDLIEHRAGPGSSVTEGTVVPCLTMQLLEGITLEECLQSARPMPAADAFPLLSQIAEALDVLHHRGVVHRDLKPSNVMLATRGDSRRAVLTDFGLAKPLDESLFETETAVHAGAPFFMAPELLRGKKPSPASDIYAFGLLIDEMVTSRRAFSADSLHGLMIQKLNEGPIRPSERAEDLPPGWEQVILRCLDPDPERRFKRASDACAALASSSQPGKWGRLRGMLSRVPRVRPLRYAALAGATAAALTGAFVVVNAAQLTTPDSVIVMPFKNLTGSAENDYLSAGTAGELGRRLSRLNGFLVYAPRDPAQNIDPDRQAAFTLTGHVQKSGPMLRFTVQLADRKNDTLLWSQNFEGPSENALQLEDAIAAETVVALESAAASRQRTTLQALSKFLDRGLAVGRRPQLPRFGTSNTEAFDAYMRGRYLFESRRLPEALAARTYLTKATELDPNFAAPYATLADLQGLLMDFHHAPHNQLLQQAEVYASQAVSLDPDLPDAQLAMAAVRQMQSRWSEAEVAFKRAIELHPKFSRAHRWYGGMLIQFGRFDDGLELMAKGLELDQFDYPSHSAYGLALFYAGRPTEAVAHLEQLIARKDLLVSRMVLGQIYAYLGGTRGSDRAAYLAKALAQSKAIRAEELEVAEGTANGSASPKTEYADIVGALAWAYQGDAEAARPFIERLEAGRAAGVVSPSMLARVYAVQGRTDDALRALEAAADQRDRELMYLSVSPYYERIRGEPRFQALRARMHLPQ